MTTNVRLTLNHLFNPLHVYCRLREAGLRQPVARRVSRAYERLVFRFLPI